jgi:hypothetical protein
MLKVYLEKEWILERIFEANADQVMLRETARINDIYIYIYIYSVKISLITSL